MTEPEDSGLFSKASHIKAGKMEQLRRDLPIFERVTACMITLDRRVFARINNRTYEMAADVLQSVADHQLGIVWRSPPSHRWPSDKLLCWDCGMDICSEFINLRNEIWVSLPGTRVPILCIGCIERRRGRRLVRCDFLPEAKFRDGYCDFGPRSARLAARLVDWERQAKAREAVAA